jgi:hypothetical protein
MLPLTTLIYLFSLPIWLLLIYKLDRRLSWIIPFVLVIILFLIFPLAQYPRIFNNDTLWHLSIAKSIASNGNLQTGTGYEIYPETFIFTAIVSDILGLPIVETSILFDAFCVILIAVFLFNIGELLTKTNIEWSEICWLPPTIFLVFDFMFYNNYHYSPQLVGFCLYTIFLYTCIRMLHFKSRALDIILLILLLTITFTHVFSGFFSVITLFSFYIGGIGIKVSKLKSERLISLTLFLFGVLVFLFWHNFFAIEPFVESIRFLPELVRGERPLFGIIEAVTPGFSLMHGLEAIMPFLSFYRYGIYTVFALMSAFGLLLYWPKAEGKLFFWLGVGILLGGIAVYLTPATFGVRRILHYGGVVISVLSSYAVIRSCRSHVGIINRVSKAFKAMLPFLVIGTFLVANVYNCTYTQFVHTDETTAMEFVVKRNTKQISMLLVDAYIIKFFAKDPLPILAISDEAPINTAETMLENGELSFQYLPRLRLYYNMSFVEGRNHLIYSNGLTRIYAKTIQNGTG